MVSIPESPFGPSAFAGNNVGHPVSAAPHLEDEPERESDRVGGGVRLAPADVEALVSARVIPLLAIEFSCGISLKCLN